MKSNKEIKTIAKRAMGISREKLISISLVTILLGGVNLLLFLLTQLTVLMVSAGLHAGTFGTAASIVKYVYLGLVLYLMVSIFIGGFIELGYDRILLMRLRNNPIPKGMVFYYKSMWFQAMTLRLFMTIRVVLWSLLFFIPGINALLSYSMAPYLIAQNPKMDPAQAIRISKHLMRGYKMKFLKLMLRFMDEILIGILTFGLAFVYVIPRMKMAAAEFYRERVALHDEEIRNLQGTSAR